MVVKVATKPEFLVAKEKMLVALVTVSVAISSPANDTSLILKHGDVSEVLWQNFEERNHGKGNSHTEI